ncbi:cell division protein ZipA C-terminal FtsZ-binding domain-containing protein [Neisseriaceae bacterium ESL0693]|nr:cell division protein ZipA C-terminal FtsZ-binding domain-containing protein [Neisseriaceae bacterium ESL0693]
MNDSVVIILVVSAAVILAVLAYNMYQENKCRKQLRDQFGHANKDALMDSSVDSVRDGHVSPSVSVPVADEAATGDTEAVMTVADDDQEKGALPEEAVATEPSQTNDTTGSKNPAPTFAQFFSGGHISQDKRKPLLDVEDMASQPLPWFDVRFDYLAYVALYEPRELHAMPRLSSRHRFRLIGCTMDNRFQIAEPIPSVYYQGFVMGLQTISRSGLVSKEELAQFGEQVAKFVAQLDGQLLLTDVDAFLEIAQPLDELCARVDQTIAIHLVSRTNISGMELRTALEQQQFELAADGAFYLTNTQMQPLFSVVSLDNTPFTAALLANQNYRGFSMLFDVALVGGGEKCFDQFMDIAVKLSSQLGLDLVNDKLEELSTQWLREVRRYVIERQKEMNQVNIEPGSELAQRLFS